MYGTISVIVDKKGFGFIRRPGDSDLFFHHTELRGLEFDKQLKELDVEFEIKRDPRTGKPQAANVRPRV